MAVDGNVSSPQFPWPGSTPLVAQITDDNHDGKVDARDQPDVVFTITSTTVP